MKKRITALVLGGGGSRGAYEVGVWQALRELNVKIDMVFGTSVGSINGAMVAQDDFEATLKLWKELETCMVFDIDTSNLKHSFHSDLEFGGMTGDEALAYAKEIIVKGGADTCGLREILNNYVNEAAIRASSVEYGLVTVNLPDFTAHHLYKEDIADGRLMDYILASASCFPAVKSHLIDSIQYIDGGYADNLPVGMALAKGATHIIAVDLQAVGYVRKDDLEKAENLIMVKSQWDLGNFLIFDTDNSKRIIRLGYLDAMKAFGAYEGDHFTFIKGIFTEDERKGADAAAKIFDLNPLFLYTRDTLNAELQGAVETALAVMRCEIKIDKSLLTNKRKLLKTLTLLTKKISWGSRTLFMAEHLKESPGEDNLLLSLPARKLLPLEIAAAQYLIDNEFI